MTSTARPFAIALALAVVYLVWGSTYLAIRVAVHELPPFLLAGSRFLAAGLLLYALVRWRGAAAPSWRAWAAASVVGLATFVVSHGLLAWASQFVASGTAALVSSVSPAWIALGGAAGLVTGHRPTALGLAGIGVGLAGVALAVDPTALVAGGGPQLAAVGALVAGSLAWAVGSILTRWSALPPSAPLTAGMSMTTGGIVLLLVSAALGEPARVDVTVVPPAAWGALAYLTLVGSLLAYACYVWLLRVDGPARVSAHAFVNPLVAVVLGAALASEPLTARTVAAATLVVGGVALLNLGSRLAGLRARFGRAPSARAPVAPCPGCPA
jgi:drug/metabolite transporter (DMT)-like permease